MAANDETEEGLQAQPMKKPPFVRYKSDAEKAEEKRRILPTSINNASDEEVLADLRYMLNIDGESTAMKKGAEIARNVLQALFGKENMHYLTRMNRARPEDEIGKKQKY